MEMGVGKEEMKMWEDVGANLVSLATGPAREVLLTSYFILPRPVLAFPSSCASHLSRYSTKTGQIRRTDKIRLNEEEGCR